MRGKLVTDIIISLKWKCWGLNFYSNIDSYWLFFAIAWICAWFSLSYFTCLGNTSRLVLFFITIYLTFSIFMSITLSPHDFSFFWRTTNIRNKSARWKTFSYIKWAFSATRLQNGLYLALLVFALVADVLELSKLSTENKPSNECVISQSTLVLQLNKLLALQGQLVNPSTLYVEYKFMITQKKPTGTIGSIQTFYFK